MSRRGLDLSALDEIVFRLSNGEQLDAKYSNHVLRGKYSGFFECHIKPDWLLIYLIQEDTLILTLIDIGSHSDLF